MRLYPSTKISRSSLISVLPPLPRRCDAPGSVAAAERGVDDRTTVAHHPASFSVHEEDGVEPITGMRDLPHPGLTAIVAAQDQSAAVVAHGVPDLIAGEVDALELVRGPD